MQRCDDGTIINRWHRHAYANHPLDLGTQHLLTATMPLSQESDARSLIFVRAAGKDESMKIEQVPGKFLRSPPPAAANIAREVHNLI